MECCRNSAGANSTAPSALSTYGKSQAAVGGILGCFFLVLLPTCRTISPSLRVALCFRLALRMPQCWCRYASLQHECLSSMCLPLELGKTLKATKRVQKWLGAPAEKAWQQQNIFLLLIQQSIVTASSWTENPPPTFITLLFYSALFPAIPPQTALAPCRTCLGQACHTSAPCSAPSHQRTKSALPNLLPDIKHIAVNGLLCIDWLGADHTEKAALTSKRLH